MADATIDDQIRLARESENLAAKRRFYQIGEWGLLNAMASHFSLTNGAASNLRTSGAPAPLVPFGSTNNNIDNSRAGLSPLGLLGLTALAGLGGVGAASMAGVFDKAAPPPAVQRVVEDAEQRVFIDWEMVPNNATGNN